MTNLFNISETVFFLDPERDHLRGVKDVSMGKIIGIELISNGAHDQIIYTVSRIYAIDHKEAKRFKSKNHKMSEGCIERSFSALKFKLQKYAK
jgi:hypothetical protein